MSLKDRINERQDIPTLDQPIGHAERVAAHRPGSDGWLEQRKNGIGGSDAAVCLGLQPYGRTRPDLWEHKTGRADHSPAGSEAIRFGTIIEPHIREWLRRRADDSTGYEAFRHLRPDESTLVHPDRSWQQAHIDGVISPTSVVAGVEIKCSSIEYLDDSYTWIDGVRLTHYAQIQHYMAVTGIGRWHYVYVIPPADRRFTRRIPDKFDLPEIDYWQWVIDESEVHTETVMADADYIQRLTDAEYDFWQHVTEDTRPEPWTPDGEITVDDPELAEMLDEYGRVHATIKSHTAPEDLEGRKEQLKDQIKARAQSIAGSEGDVKKIWVSDEDYVLWHGGYSDWTAKPAEREPMSDDDEIPF